MKKRKWLPKKAIDKLKQKRIAKERIEILTKMIEKNPDWAKRYKELIKRIAKKYRLGAKTKVFKH